SLTKKEKAREETITNKVIERKAKFWGSERRRVVQAMLDGIIQSIGTKNLDKIKTKKRIIKVKMTAPEKYFEKIRMSWKKLAEER
ncbi:hypothetical protein GINT2_001804, partial [Glugoides intestinalis]